METLAFFTGRMDGAFSWRDSGHLHQSIVGGCVTSYFHSYLFFLMPYPDFTILHKIPRVGKLDV